MAIANKILNTLNCNKILGLTKAQYKKFIGIDTGLQLIVITQPITCDLGPMGSITVSGSDFVSNTYNATGDVVHTLSSNGGASYSNTLTYSCPAAGIVTIKLKSVDDLTTRIQDVVLNVRDNMGVC